MARRRTLELAAKGSTGNATGAAVEVPVGCKVALQFLVEAVGATPTVDFKYQGSFDGIRWYDVTYVINANDTLATAALTVTAVGGSLTYIASQHSRHYRYLRVVTSSNTNVTFSAKAFPEPAY